MKHNDVPDEIAMRVRDAVLEGMGMVFLLLGALHSKPFKFLLRTSCNLSWREDGDLERVWVCKPFAPHCTGTWHRYF